MKCPFCGSRVERKRATFTCEHRGRFLLVANVPAEVCVQCGEKTYTPKVTDELLKFAREESKPAKTLKVPVFDFAEKDLESL